MCNYDAIEYVLSRTALLSGIGLGDLNDNYGKTVVWSRPGRGMRAFASGSWQGVGSRWFF